MESIRHQSYFSTCYGHSGGLIYCWNSDLFELANYESMQNCLGITLKVLLTGHCFCMFNIYGPHSRNSKKTFWKNLKRLNDVIKSSPSIFI